ncbi:hypothetical protein BDR04DRAFT_284125 [Suillus decipiens]|nr:hypothetical protein BDR04DRAFT_284125 [Suillus decipiens]
MLGVSSGDKSPPKPSRVYAAHPSTQKVVTSLWGLVTHNISGHSSTIVTQASTCWPTRLLISSGGWQSLSVFRDPMTFGLHCAELVANVIRNESQWRGRKRQDFKQLHVYRRRLSLGCALIQNPVLHWIFNLAFTSHISGCIYCPSAAATTSSHLQIWNLFLALGVFASLTAVRRPRSLQLVTIRPPPDTWANH